MKLITVVGDKEFESWEIPEDAKTSEVLVISVANKDLQKMTLLRFMLVKKTEDALYFDLDSAFSLGKEHLESVKRVSFE